MNDEIYSNLIIALTLYNTTVTGSKWLEASTEDYCINRQALACKMSAHYCRRLEGIIDRKKTLPDIFTKMQNGIVAITLTNITQLLVEATQCSEPGESVQSTLKRWTTDPKNRTWSEWLYDMHNLDTIFGLHGRYGINLSYMLASILVDTALIQTNLNKEWVNLYSGLTMHGTALVMKDARSRVVTTLPEMRELVHIIHSEFTEE